jgi:hypothetical protein
MPARELAQMVIELVEDDEGVVEIFLTHSEYLLPIGRVDREDSLRASLHDTHPELRPLDVVVLGKQVEGLLRIRVEDAGDDERLEPVVGLPLCFFCRVPARYV